MSNFTLCIDLGSTCFKAAVFDENLKQLGEFPYYISYLNRHNKAEIAVKEVETAFSDILFGVIEKAGISIERIGKIGITSQAQTFMLAEDGQPLTQFITWEDCRGKVMTEGAFADFANHSSFYQMLPVLQISQLIRLNHAGVIGPQTKAVSLPSYLVKMLCGNLVIDANLAGMTGMYSLITGDWQEDFLESCNLSKEQVGQLVPLGSVAGQVKINPFGLPEGIPVYCCGNDQTSGAFGANLTGNDMLMTLGTAQVLYQVSDTMPEPAPKIVRGPYVGDKFYRLMCVPGGSLVSKTIQNHRQIMDYDDFFAQAATGQSITDFKFDENGQIKFNSQNSHDFAFSMLEYMCRLMKDMYGKFVEIGGTPERLLVAGGGSRNKLWVEMLEGALGEKLIKVDANPLLGAARMILNSSKSGS